MLLVCVESLRVDTTTAAPVAAAARELVVEAIAEDLLPALKACSPALGSLLRLFLAAVR